jgi:hypothetical protein
MPSWTNSGNDIYYSGGNVGIGTSSPGANLHVNGTSALGGTVTQIGATSQWYIGENVDGANPGVWMTRSVFYGYQNGLDNANGNTYLSMNGGNVGIGTKTPSASLDVAGNVLARQLAGVAIVAPGVNGVVGNGSADDEPEISAIVSGASEIWFFPGRYRIAANAIWAAGKTIRMFRGAYIEVDGNVTLTIRSLFRADPHKVFGSSAAGYDLQGTVTGIAAVTPLWWGALVNDSSTGVPAKNADAINKAIASVEASGSSDAEERSILFPVGSVYISKSLTFTPSTSISWRIRGSSTYGSALVATSSFTGGHAVFVGTTGGGQPSTDFEISNLRIQNQLQSGGPAYGLIIGPTSGLMHGFRGKALVENVSVEGFTVCWQVQNCRLITFRRCASWASDFAGTEKSGNHGMIITAFSGGMGGSWANFCGDLDFYDCQFIAPLGSNPSVAPSGKGVTINDLGTPSTHLSGIRFTNCIWYGGLQCLELIGAASGSQVDDIWVVGGSQFEGVWNASGRCVSGYVDNGAVIFDVHIDNCYMVGSGFYKNLELLIHSGGGTINTIYFTRNTCNNTLHEIVDLRAGDGTGNAYGTAYLAIVSDNIIRDPNGGHGAANAAIYFENVTAATANGNTMYSTNAGNTRLNLVLFNVSGTYQTAVGNNSGGRTSGAAVPATGRTGGNTANNV